MQIDANGQMYGQLFGQDRIGQTTPDLESSEWIRPWIPSAYPAPWLPTQRQDQGHPKLASIVIPSFDLVGQDKNGGLVPAGYFCGTQPASKQGSITNSKIEGGIAELVSSFKAQLNQAVVIAGLTNATAANGTFNVIAVTTTGFLVAVGNTTDVAAGAESAGTVNSVNPGQYCVIAYAPYDVGFAFNPQTAARVTAAGQYAVLAAPVDAANGDTVTLPNGTVITILTGDITFAQACDLFTTGKVRPIGVAVRNVYQFLGGVSVGANLSATSSTTGINYTLDGMNPVGFNVLNYMHEMATAIQTQFVLKLPWIGATPTTLASLASGDGVTGYQQLFGRTFAHFTGAMGAAASDFGFGSGVVASSAGNGADAGSFAPYNPAVHTPQDLAGRVIGIQNLNPVQGTNYLGRVRTLFDRPMVGPMVDPNSAAIRMGGSATRGIPYHISVTTDAAFAFAYDQNKTLHPEYSTQVIVRVNL